MEIILASQSPRRRELLKKMDISFSVRNIDISEEIYNEENPQDYVLRMAETKAAEGARTEKNALVIGAGNIVCINNEISEKPKDKEDAAKILNKTEQHTLVLWCILNLIMEKRLFLLLRNRSNLQKCLKRKFLIILKLESLWIKLVLMVFRIKVLFL